MIEIKNRKKLKAMCAVVIMLAAGIGCAVLVDDDTTEESDAFWVVIWGGYLLLTVTVAFLAGMGAGYAIASMGSDSGNPANDRANEANLVAQSILQGTAYTNNSFNQLKQIWNLTDEHFIRFAELSASFSWEKDKQYEAEPILLGSTAYQNAAIAVANSSVETSLMFDNIGERLGIWNSKGNYANQMTVSWEYGSNSFGSKTAFGGQLTSVAVPDATHNKVYISDVTDLWVYGGSATLTATDGSTVTMSQGKNDLTSGFQPGIYKLQTGRTYAGPMVYVIDPAAAPVTSGVVMQAGTDYKIAKYDQQLDRVIIDGNQYTTLSIRVTPDGAPTPDPAPITQNLKDLRSMMTKVNQTLMNANASANAVWNIFDSMGAASTYLTTLMVPDNYDGIYLTTAQKEIMLRSTMLQFGQMVQDNKQNIRAEDFSLSSASMGLFCRGNIYDSHGQILYENIIFTPLFYNHDYTIKTGNNITDQPAMIAIWTSGPTLSAWNFTTSTDASAVPPIGPGSTIYISEMKNQGSFVSSVNLVVKKISFINGTDWEQKVRESEEKDTNWAVYLIIAGIILCIVSIIPRFRPLLYVGLMLAAGGAAWYALDSIGLLNLLAARAGGDFT